MPSAHNSQRDSGMAETTYHDKRIGHVIQTTWETGTVISALIAPS
jgi:hypothetical protein